MVQLGSESVVTVWPSTNRHKQLRLCRPNNDYMNTGHVPAPKPSIGNLG